MRYGFARVPHGHRNACQESMLDSIVVKGMISQRNESVQSNSQSQELAKFPRARHGAYESVKSSIDGM
jgi:hypothetical protein